MNQGVKTILYPVTDLAKATALYTALLGVEPVINQPYYVQFVVGDLTIGLDPNGTKQGLLTATPYYHVSDIKTTLQTLLDGGSETVQALRDVGGGRQVASVKDADGNIIGLIQDAVK